MKKVSIITVNFNQPLLTEQLLSSIAAYNTYSSLEIIVVDNASKINPVPQWKVKYNNIRFIRSEVNLGFAGGNNLGVREASGEYLFFVNNDTEFTTGLVETLVDLMDKNETIGMISPKIRFFQQPDIIQYAGFTPMNFNTARNKCIGEFEEDKGQYDDTTGSTGYIHGAAMMVRKTAIDQVGLMPENFFLYYEEMDWCEQIKRAGYQIWLAPRALIYHKESMSVGKKSPLKEFFMTRNRILFTRRNAPALSRLIFCFHYALLVSPRNIFGYLREGRRDLAVQFLKGVWWNITHNRDSEDLGYPISRIP